MSFWQTIIFMIVCTLCLTAIISAIRGEVWGPWEAWRDWWRRW